MRTPPNITYTWEDALVYANGRNTAGLCGHDTGWRLPNILELGSLINLGQAGSSQWLILPENGFVGITANKHWSSTTAASSTGMAWTIDLTDDRRTMEGKNLLYFVLPVHGVTALPAQLHKTGQTSIYGSGDDGDLEAGVAWPSPRFASPASGTVKDNLTGLMWTEDANTPGPLACTPGVAKSSFRAYQFIRCLNNSNYLGYSDWRLPNRKELESLIDYSQHDPALPSGHQFSTTVFGIYWSSDTYLPVPSSGWAVEMNGGQVTYTNKNLVAWHVWPVRGPLSLQVLITGDGEGEVTGNQVSCDGRRCLGVFNNDEVVTITAVNPPDSIFDGWTGCPSPSGNQCTITMHSDTTITATFLPAKSVWSSPKSLKFGKVGVGVVSPQKYIAVKNLKTTDLYIESVTITNTAEFIQDDTCAGTTLHPGETCSIALSVEASGYGTRRGELLVAFNDAKVPFVKIKLTAKAMPAKVSVTPKTVRFGKVSMSGSATKQMTIVNSGPTPLTISAITIGDGEHMEDFAVDPSVCPVLQLDQECVLDVTFTPKGIGKRLGSLAISSDAPKKSLVNVKLKGEGI